jgi:hypothetical protein
MTKRSDVIVGVLALFAAAVGALFLVAFNRARHAAETPAVRHIAVPIFGCQSLATANQVGTLISQHDHDAVDQVLQEGFASGECAELNAGTPVFVSNRQPTGLIEVRPKGDPRTYWTVSNAVGP